MLLCFQDALLAVEHGCDGIVLSNHGGRQLDCARSGLEVLPEVMRALRSAGYEKRIEVMIDGGVRRGTDIFKALAMGVSSVGMSRPLLYALAGYGQVGVERCIALLREEFENCMRMVGVTRVSDISPRHVCFDSLSQHAAAVPEDSLFNAAYVPLAPSRSKL